MPVTDAERSQAGRPSVIMTMLLILGAVGFMAVFFALYRLFGIGSSSFGLLFLVYWGAILRQDLAAFWPTVVGGLIGILLGWLLLAFLPLHGQGGTIGSTLLVAALLFCFMRAHIPLAVNNATMLFLTVATIGELRIADTAVTMALSMLVGAGYLGAVTLAMRAVMARRAAGAETVST